MLTVKYKRGLLNMMNLYGSMDMKNKNATDIIISSKVLFPTIAEEEQPSSRNVLHSYGKTLVIDLQRSEEEIFAAIHKNTKYKINRARKRDALVYHELTSPTNEEIDKFLQFFNRFAKHKNIPNGNVGMLKGLRDQSALIISYITDMEEQALCYHAYLKTSTYSSLLHSASARFENSGERNRIGRANRFLHWKDIVSFKRMGHTWYDFGGLFIEQDDQEELHINRFKKEFGGQSVDVDKKIYALTLIGRLTVFLFWLRMRKRPDFIRAHAMKRDKSIAFKNM